MQYIAFFFGLIIGSFLNVLIVRLNTGKSLGGRSACFSCGKVLTWKELIPIFSYLLQGGKCKGCKCRISIQYPLVEGITGIIFYLIVLKYGLDLISVLYLISASILIAITGYDLKHKIIPNSLVYLFIVISLFVNYLNGPIQLDSFSFLIGPVLFAFFAFFWLISGGRWMGFGDAKLALGIGWLLGFSGGVLAMLIAFWSGAIIGIILLALSRGSITIKYELPFAPFLVFGTFVALLVNFNVFEYISLSL